MYTRQIFAILLLALPLSLLAGHGASALTRDEALTRLIDGNTRFVNDQPVAWSADSEKRVLLNEGQHPFACIVTCSDSRLSPEIIFDQSMGDVFVVRNAGNVPSPEMIGSVEYAVEHLGVAVVVVMGHSKCGAVTAACGSDVIGGALGSIISRIRPAVLAASQYGLEGDALRDKAIELNEQMTATRILEGSENISQILAKHNTSIITATYSLESGMVTFGTELAGVVLPEADKADSELHAEKAGAAVEAHTAHTVESHKETPEHEAANSTESASRSSKRSSRHH